MRAEYRGRRMVGANSVVEHHLADPPYRKAVEWRATSILTASETVRTKMHRLLMPLALLMVGAPNEVETRPGDFWLPWNSGAGRCCPGAIMVVAWGVNTVGSRFCRG